MVGRSHRSSIGRCDGRRFAPDGARAAIAVSVFVGIAGSKHSHVRELRVQSGGHPIRVFYAFDPRRSAILLIGGDKTGDDRFYQRMIPIADALYDTYIEEIRKEGLIP